MKNSELKNLEPDSAEYREKLKEAEDHIEEAIKVCEGEIVDCRGFVKERRLDGKCNNLRNKTTTNWGASAIKLRRMTPAAYDEDDVFKHRPRKVKVETTSYCKI